MIDYKDWTLNGLYARWDELKKIHAADKTWPDEYFDIRDELNTRRQ